MNIGLMGVGKVGNALLWWLENYTDHTVLKKDPAKGFNDDFCNVDAVFISVPVPTNKDTWEQDYSILEGCVYDSPNVPIFVRSTVLPGTCDRLASGSDKSVYACPEFLTERRANLGMSEYPILVGSYGNQMMTEFVKQIFIDKKIITVNNTEAEIGKFFNNINGAVNVMISNEMHQACLKFTNVNYRRALMAANTAGQVGNMYRDVPGPDGHKGYGGNCFLKDTKAFAEALDIDWLKGIVYRNEVIRGEVKGEEQF